MDQDPWARPIGAMISGIGQRDQVGDQMASRLDVAANEFELDPPGRPWSCAQESLPPRQISRRPG